MEILSNLYKSAETHLYGDTLDWYGFIGDFRQIFNAHGVLYTLLYSNEFSTVDDIAVLAASDPETTDRYVAQKMYLQSAVQESDLEDLEPARRSDHYDDATFEQMGPLADFFIPAGMYYVMAVPARLSPQEIVSLSVWRSKAEGDFSDLEKQRLALFMRHLVVVVDPAHLRVRDAGGEVVAFGDKWGLTRTETALLSALLQGLSLREVAEQTGRSYGTVRWHMQNILSKCQVSSQKDLLREFYALIKR